VIAAGLRNPIEQVTRQQHINRPIDSGAPNAGVEVLHSVPQVIDAEAGMRACEVAKKRGDEPAWPCVM
jgi:hypothetical protein